ncbi:MAG: VOC family protein [Acidimicrobiia bacterium]|nr:VOC family protein [Acidimicrobiia bacterium]
MPIHHVAIATRDLEATHEFYTEAMGFELVKVVKRLAPQGDGGWSRHVFYDTGGDGLFAVWDLHLLDVDEGWRTEISKGLGLPTWVNHVAFTAHDRDDLGAKKRRLLEHGWIVTEVDHGFVRSVYVLDPNGILVEFCLDQEPLTEADREEAERLLLDDTPATIPELEGEIHRPATVPSR